MVAERPTSTSELDAIPERERHQMVSGMRWTIWATLISAPLAYFVSTLLARLGPEVIGAYGLTSVYSFFASTFLFIGGGAVVAKFTPALPTDKRLSFLATYLLVVLGLALPWQILGTLKPSLLHYAFGDSGNQAIHVLLLWVAPLYVFYLLVDSALAAVLDIRYQQLLRRCMSIIAFVLYTSAYFLGRNFLLRHYIALIWTVYLGLALGAGMVGAWQLVRLFGNHSGKALLSTFVPSGFWRYTVGVQVDSVLGLFSGFLGVLTLNAGGISIFGRLVVLTAVGNLVDRPVQLVLSTFLPSLTNAMQLRNPEAPVAVVTTWSRLVLACALIAAVVVSLFAGPLIHLFGHGYADLVPILPISCASSAIDALNQLICSILYGISRPYANVVGRVAKLSVLLVCFWPLWARYHLVGTALTWLICVVVQCAVLILMLAASKTHIIGSLWKTVGPYTITLGAVLLLARWATFWGLEARATLYVACIAFFLVAARYSFKELAGLTRLVLPSRSLRNARFVGDEAGVI